jgi:tRNA(Ile)-lysidine synthase
LQSLRIDVRRSHPPTLLKLAERTIADEHLLGAGDFVLVAVSGGPDSMALLHVLAKLAPRFGARVAAHGVDHGLRAAAASELALVERFARELGVPFTTSRVEVGPGANLMARAREARYASLEKVLRRSTERDGGRSEGRAESHDRSATGAALIATGHHADDRAETVLIRLLRGTGPAGLAVLPPRSAHLIRPFVRARRTDIVAHAERHGIPFAHDPTNRDPRFLRTRVRHELLPLLADLSPRIVEHLCALADASSARGGPEEEGAVPETLEGLPLGRAQRSALARALKNRNRAARVPLSGGRIAAVDLFSRRIVLIKGR